MQRELDAVLLTDDDLDAVLKLVLRSDRMVRRRPGDDGVDRERLLESLEQYLLTHSFTEAADAVPRLRAMFRSIDKGYLAIYKSEAALPFARLSPQQRIDSIFGALQDTGMSIQADFDRSMQQAEYLSAGMKFHDSAGTEYNPSAVFHGLTLAATDALLMEAYQNGYLRGSAMVLPSVNPSSAHANVLAQGKLANAGLWRHWKSVDEHHRYLAAKLEEFNAPELPDWMTQVPVGSAVRTVLEFEPDVNLQVLDYVATERFDQRMHQTLHDMIRRTDLLRIVAPKGSQYVPLPPAGILSTEEAHAGALLGEYLSMRLDQTPAGSMMLHERLRGYAVLQRYARGLIENYQTHFPRVLKTDLEAELVRCGLSAKATAAFIKEATFGKSNRDFYDQPLIQLDDGSYILFGFALLAADLVKVMMSSLQNAKLSFQRRGPAYESEVIRLLKEEGFSPRNLRVYRGPDKEEFDYDVTFVWDEYVFFLECKSRSMPFGQPIALANFMMDIHGHAVQVARLRKALTEYPDIIDVDYPEAKGKTPVFCVVNALPFSLGLAEDVYYIDQSLLGRFFKAGGTFGREMGKLQPGAPAIRATVAPLWAGTKPTVVDFISYITAPPQLRLAAHHYQLAAQLIQLSPDTIMKVTNLVRVGLDDEEVARVLAAATNRQQDNSAGVG